MLEWWGECDEAEGMSIWSVTCLQHKVEKKSGPLQSLGGKVNKTPAYRYRHPCSRGDVAMLTPPNNTFLPHLRTCSGTYVPGCEGTGKMFNDFWNGNHDALSRAVF